MLVSTGEKHQAALYNLRPRGSVINVDTAWSKGGSRNASLFGVEPLFLEQPEKLHSRDTRQWQPVAIVQQHISETVQGSVNRLGDIGYKPVTFLWLLNSSKLA